MKNNFPAQNLSRILVRGTNWLGDAVMTAPALLRLREKFPAAHIALLAPEKLRELWLNHPAIDEFIPFAPEENLFSVAKRLRAGKFDLAVVFPNSPRSALEVFFAGIPNRLGISRGWRDFFLKRAVPPRANEMKTRKLSAIEVKARVASAPRKTGTRLFSESISPIHQSRDYLHLVSALGANPAPLPPKLFVASDEVETARKKFGLAEISRPIFGLNAGAEYGPAKRWPVERFIAAAKVIREKTECAWILFGGKNDAVITNQIEAALEVSPFPVFNLAGKTSLRELMALLKICRVLLTNDTGPMHVAAALGTRVVVPFGSTSPELTAPISSGATRHQILKSVVPCSPCFRRECPIDFRCMNGIEVEQVVEAVLEATK